MVSSQPILLPLFSPRPFPLECLRGGPLRSFFSHSLRWPHQFTAFKKTHVMIIPMYTSPTVTPSLTPNLWSPIAYLIFPLERPINISNVIDPRLNFRSSTVSLLLQQGSSPQLRMETSLFQYSSILSCLFLNPSGNTFRSTPTIYTNANNFWPPTPLPTGSEPSSLLTWIVTIGPAIGSPHSSQRDPFRM